MAAETVEGAAQRLPFRTPCAGTAKVNVTVAA